MILRFPPLNSLSRLPTEKSGVLLFLRLVKGSLRALQNALFQFLRLYFRYIIMISLAGNVFELLLVIAVSVFLLLWSLATFLIQRLLLWLSFQLVLKIFW